MRHLILTLDELTAIGVAFVSLGEGIHTNTPAVACNFTSSVPSRSLNGRGSLNVSVSAWTERSHRFSDGVPQTVHIAASDEDSTQRGGRPNLSSNPGREADPPQRERAMSARKYFESKLIIS